MKKKVFWITLIFIFFLIILGLILFFNKSIISKNSTCSKDSDCVPSSCCHSKICVNISQSPNCEGVACTFNCEPETLDCGGSCSCNKGECIAILK